MQTAAGGKHGEPSRSRNSSWMEAGLQKKWRKEYGGQEALTLLRRYKCPSTTPHFHQIWAAPKRCALGFYFNPRRNLGPLLALKRSWFFLLQSLSLFGGLLNTTTLTPWLHQGWRLAIVTEFYFYFSLDGQSWTTAVTGVSCKSFSLKGMKNRQQYCPLSISSCYSQAL